MILVTGGSSFLGQPVCKQLTEQGYPVLDASLKPIQVAAYPCQQVDIARAAELEERFAHNSIDTNIHLAALLNTKPWKIPRLTVDQEVMGSILVNNN